MLIRYKLLGLPVIKCVTSVNKEDLSTREGQPAARSLVVKVQAASREG